MVTSFFSFFSRNLLGHEFLAFSLRGQLHRLCVTSWILQTAKIKCITEGFWVNRIFETDSSSRLNNYSYSYSYSFRKQPAASFFKNKNCCFPDQGNVTPTNVLKKNLTYFLNFKAYSKKILVTAKASLAFIKNKCKSSLS